MVVGAPAGVGAGQVSTNNLPSRSQIIATSQTETVKPALGSGDTAPVRISPELVARRELVQRLLGEDFSVRANPNGELYITGEYKSLLSQASIDGRMSVIKDRLGLPDGAIGSLNPEVYEKLGGENVLKEMGESPNDAVLVKGGTIAISASDVGKNPNWLQKFTGTFNEIK